MAKKEEITLNKATDKEILDELKNRRNFVFVDDYKIIVKR